MCLKIFKKCFNFCYFLSQRVLKIIGFQQLAAVEPPLQRNTNWQRILVSLDLRLAINFFEKKHFKQFLKTIDF